MYCVLGLPGLLTYGFLDKHSTKCDLNFVCSYSRLAGLLPYAKSVPQSDNIILRLPVRSKAVCIFVSVDTELYTLS